MEGKKSVVVTGSSGFIGSHLVFLLKKMNYKVIAINKKSTESIADEVITFERFVQDSYVPSVFDDVACVFNIANTYDSNEKNSISQDVLNSNLILPLKLVEIFANKSIPIILPGSYLQNRMFFDSNDNISLYISMKNFVENVYNYYAKNYGLLYIRTRQYESYGKGDTRPRLLNRLVSNLEKGQSISRIDKDFELDFVHVLDLCNGYIEIFKQIESKTISSGATIELSSKKYVKYSELLALLEETLNLTFIHKSGSLTFDSNDVGVLHETAPWPIGWQPRIEFKTGLFDMFRRV